MIGSRSDASDLGSVVIDLYYYPSPNTRKIRMALEELALDYAFRTVDITQGEQFDPDFVEINPNSKVPAIVDHDGPDGRPVTLFESGAILLYLSEKTGRLMPADPASRWEATCWIFWQAANQGPGLGNAAYFHSYAPELHRADGPAHSRFVREAERCYGILEKRLDDGRTYLFDDLSMVDIACFPWTRVAAGHGVDIGRFPKVRAWSERLAGRPSARMERPDRAPDGRLTPEQAAVLFPER